MWREELGGVEGRETQKVMYERRIKVLKDSLKVVAGVENKTKQGSTEFING